MTLCRGPCGFRSTGTFFALGLPESVECPVGVPWVLTEAPPVPSPPLDSHAVRVITLLVFASGHRDGRQGTTSLFNVLSANA